MGHIYSDEIDHELFQEGKYYSKEFLTLGKFVIFFRITLLEMTSSGPNFCLDQFHTRWLLPGTLVSSTNETDRLNITEILLKVALNTITLPPISFQELFYCYIFIMYQLSCSIGQIILTE
jgi:hypothetical protein